MQKISRGSRPRAFGDYGVGEDALGRAGATRRIIRLRRTSTPYPSFWLRAARPVRAAHGSCERTCHVAQIAGCGPRAEGTGICPVSIPWVRPGSLIIGEEEKFILPDRAAEACLRTDSGRRLRGWGKSNCARRDPCCAETRTHRHGTHSYRTSSPRRSGRR